MAKRDLNPVPVSLFLFLLSGVSLGLQYIAGGFLYFLAAPLWSIALINLGFVGICLEVFGKIVKRYWLILPFSWFFGYAFATAWSHYQCYRFEQATSAQNISPASPIVDVSQPILLNSRDRLVDVEAVSRVLVATYEVSAIFFNPNIDVKNRYLATRLGLGEACDPSSFADASVMDFIGNPDVKRSSWRCWISLPESPREPHATVDIAQRQHGEFNGQPVSSLALSVGDGDRRSFKLMIGFAHPLAWWPMPMLGFCWGSERISDCSGFVRDGDWRPTKRDPKEEAAIASTIAAGLGLRKRTP